MLAQQPGPRHTSTHEVGSMFSVRTEKAKDVLTVDEDFATLVNVSSSAYTFKFHYKMARAKALQRAALKVRVTVTQTEVNLKNLLVVDPPVKFEGVRKDVSLEQSKSQIVKDAALQRAQAVVTSVVGDVTTKISNSEAAGISLKTTTEPQSFVQTRLSYVPAVQVKSAGMAVVNMSRTAASPADKKFVDPKVLAMDMIFKQGVDPSAVTDMSHKSLTPKDFTDGFKSVSRAGTEDPTQASTRLRNYLVAPNKAPIRHSSAMPDDDYVQILEHAVNDSASMHTQVDIPVVRSSRGGKVVLGSPVRTTALSQGQADTFGSYTIKFDLLGSSGTIVDSITKVLDIGRHLREFNIPKRPPNVRVARGAVESKTNLEIVQVDPRADRVRVYKKYIQNSDPNIDPYMFVGEYQVKSGKRILVAVDVPIASAACYRVIPVSQSGVMGSDFTNAVVKPLRYTQFQYASVVLKIVSSGISVSVGTLPMGVAALRILVRNASFHEDWTYVKELVTRHDESTGRDTIVAQAQTFPVNTVDPVVQVDTMVEEGNVYEYCAELVFRDGTIKRSGFASMEYVPMGKGYVKLSMEGLTVSGMGTDTASTVGKLQKSVSFNIKSVIPETSHDALKRMLQEKGLYEHFQTEVTAEKEKFSQIVSYQVKRVDVTTGHVVDYGVVSESFVESDLMDSHAAPQLSPGHKYRYDVTPLLRSPETMLTKMTKDLKDPTTKLTYSVSPAKSFHPYSLRTGTVTSDLGRTVMKGLDPMMYGRLGQSLSVDVDLTKIPTALTNLQVARFNSTTNSVSWHMPDEDKRVDHFLVLKDCQGVKTIVGKMHTEVLGGDYTFYHYLTARDSGPVSYIVRPVFMDYSHSSEYSTERVMVDPDDVEEVKERNTVSRLLPDRVLK